VRYKLTWSDEFNGAVNTPPDSTKWGYTTYDVGMAAFPTNSRANSFQDGNGNLVIRAISDSTSHPGWSYTTAVLSTRGKFSQQYGRFEARMKIPYGKGLWPGFWLEGDNVLPWPSCGEIDIVENVSTAPNRVYSTLHGPADPLGKYIKTFDWPSGNLADGFHVYALEWDKNGMTYYIDANVIGTVSKQQLLATNNWVYDQPFLIIVDLYVGLGGSWGGPPDGSTIFPADLLVDYIRVYQPFDTPAPANISRAQTKPHLTAYMLTRNVAGNIKSQPSKLN